MVFSHRYIHSGSLYVMKMTFVEFVNNSATNGGGIVLVGPSVLQVRSGSEVVFDSNHASELGGAVYATSSHLY